MKNELMNLVYSGNGDSRAVRVVIVEGEPWFMAADLAAILGYRNTPDATRMLDADEKDTHTARTPGGDQIVTIVNESGMYQIVLRSKRPEASVFRKWITGEVLPSIRKTGSYVAPGVAPALSDDPLILALQAAAENRQMALENKRDVAEVKSRTDALEQRLDDECIRSTEINVIHKLGQQLGKAMGNYPDAWRLFKTKFQLASYRDLPRREFENGKTFLERQINAWNDGGDQSPLVKA